MVTTRTAYLCYFSVTEPLVQTQVLPYLRALAASGIEVTLLTFEPADGIADTDTGERLRAEGVEWHQRRYHKWPSLPATLLDVAAGAWFVRRRIREGAVDIVHARSHVPALMAAIGRGRRRTPLFLFDLRGFMADEYVDAGLWPSGGLLFRVMKRAEGALLRRADGLVVLTERARSILAPTMPSVPIEVIPCCVDLSSFPEPSASAKQAAKERLGLADRRVVLYVGSTTGFYQFDEMIQFAKGAQAADPSTFFLVLTQRNCDSVTAQIAQAGMADDQFKVRSVAPSDLAEHALAADLALSFIPATYSKQASSPTKIAEYLACGVPIVATAGVGDIDTQIEAEGVGVLVRSLSPEGYADALSKLEPILASPGIAETCRRTATRLFDLATVGGPRYVGLYKRMIDHAPRARGR